jgi:N6-L-threonylcarbamoyladenine synthase
MIAALAYKYLQDGVRSDFSESASARVSAFKKSYP